MKVQQFKLDMPDNTASGAALPNVNRVYEWLIARGWNCTRSTVNRHAGKELIRRNAAGEFPLDAVLEYAANHWRIINPALAVPEAQSVSGACPRPLEFVATDLEPGLDQALVRLRQAETMAFQRWTRAMEEGNAPEAVFRSYGQAVELLRKAEKNLLDLQRERRELLPKNEVKTWLYRQIVTAKAALSNIPGKLAPQLEGQPWHRIQQRLDEEIRDALSKLSSDIDAPVEGSLEASGQPEPVAVGGGQS